ncbi:MAG: hypothetical protein LBC41_05780 [Clostridiales bacterium]|jgi:tetratricopeptide (TPR) repeat protein|nr:hypothetical protein [Clostridiales bacterium]
MSGKHMAAKHLLGEAGSALRENNLFVTKLFVDRALPLLDPNSENPDELDDYASALQMKACCNEMSNGDHEESVKLLEESIRIEEAILSLKTDHYLQASYINMAQKYCAVENYPKAFEYAQKVDIDSMLDDEEKVKLVLTLVNVYELISNCADNKIKEITIRTGLR